MRITKVAVALSVINCAVAAFAGEFSWTGAGEPNADGTGTLQEAVAAGAVTVVGIRRKLKKFAFVEETTGTGEELRHMLILREQPVCGLTVIIK